MQFSGADLEALQSLIEDGEGALRKLEQETNDRRLGLHKLQVRFRLFGEGDLDLGEHAALGEWPRTEAELEERRESLERRLTTLCDCLPSGE